MKLNNLISSADWQFLNVGTLNDACTVFTDRIVSYMKQSIPHKDASIRSTDKPWYDSEIRKYSRIRGV